MLKQKIAQFREYRAAKKEAKEKDAASLDLFRAWMDAIGEISITKQKGFLNSIRKPHDDSFGALNYPCIVRHQWEMSGRAFGHDIYDSDFETHHCSHYIEKSTCPMTDCYWYQKNRDAADAWIKYQLAANESKQAAEKCQEAYHAFLGERFYRRVHGR